MFTIYVYDPNNRLEGRKGAVRGVHTVGVTGILPLSWVQYINPKTVH